MTNANCSLLPTRNKSIYGFRHANAVKTLRDLRRDYRPREYELRENFRSSAMIVRAACAVIEKGGGRVDIAPVNDAHHPITLVGAASVEDEAHGVCHLIQLARRNNHQFGDVAILYRTHKRGDLIESVLLSAGIPIQRIRPGRFFDEPSVQEGLRYLELIAAMHDRSFVPALNWPRVLVDELTMIHLRKLALRHGLTLSQLADRMDLLSASCSPLTIEAIRTFRETIVAELMPLADQPISEIVDRLVRCLGQRRDPLPVALRPSLRETLDFIGRPLVDDAKKLYDAIVAGRGIAVVTDGRPDSVIASLILRGVIQRFFASSPISENLDEGHFAIALGEELSGTFDSEIAPRPTRTMTVTVSTQVWRLCQMVLMAFERLGEGRFVVYDLETSSDQPLHTEIVEIGARFVDSGRLTTDDLRIACSTLTSRGIDAQSNRRPRY